MPHDFASECREAFTNLCQTRSQIDPNQPTQRLQNQATRRRLTARIDEVLDAYLDWQTVEPFEAQMGADGVESSGVAAPDLPVDGDWRNW